MIWMVSGTVSALSSVSMGDNWSWWIGELLGVLIMESDENDSKSFDVQVKMRESNVATTKTARLEVFRAGWVELVNNKH